MQVLVTVGTTVFPLLIHSILLPSTLLSFQNLGIRKLIVQHGFPLPTFLPSLKDLPLGLELKTMDYTNQLNELILESDVIISHAGAGTILETLRAKKKLIVVINTELMHNHQSELAIALEPYLLVTDTPKDIPTLLKLALSSDYAPIPFPSQDMTRFPSLLYEVLYLNA